MQPRNDVDPVRSAGSASVDATGRIRRLEQRLAAARDLEARRARRVEKARRRGAPRSVEARRTRKLEKARRRGAALEAKIAALRTATGPAQAVLATAAPAVPEVLGFCLREKRRVAVADAAPIVMRNGRSGLAGTCPSCGARVVRPR